MFKLKQSKKDSLWYFNLPAVNGEVVLQSEGYTTKAMAIKGMVSVVVNAAKASLKRALGMAWYVEVEDDYVAPVVIEETPAPTGGDTTVEEVVVKSRTRRKRNTPNN
jgi:uncharacterized protein YegP (UPF0339 family)